MMKTALELKKKKQPKNKPQTKAKNPSKHLKFRHKLIV